MSRQKVNKTGLLNIKVKRNIKKNIRNASNKMLRHKRIRDNKANNRENNNRINIINFDKNCRK